MLKTLPWPLAFAALTLLPSLNACVVMKDTISRSDRALGEAEVVDERITDRRPHVELALAEQEIVVTLSKDILCQKKMVQNITRHDQVQRSMPPWSWAVLGGEYTLSTLLGGLGLVQTLGPGASDPNTACAGMLNLGLALSLCGAAGIHSLVYFAGTDQDSDLQDSYWSESQQCQTLPAPNEEIVLQIGAMRLQGRTDSQGRWRAASDPPEALLQTLFSQQGRLKVEIPAANFSQDRVIGPAAPRINAALNVESPGATPQSLLTPLPTTQPQPNISAPAPNPSTDSGSAEPPMPQALPQGAAVSLDADDDKPAAEVNEQ